MTTTAVLTSDHTLTVPMTPVVGSALDPMVEEGTWTAWALRAIDPVRFDADRLEFVTGWFDHVVETAWSPGRSAILVEAAARPREDGPTAIDVSLLIGCLGPTGSTAREIAGLAAVTDRLVRMSDDAVTSEQIDPRTVLDAGAAARSALIRQRTVDVDCGDHTVEVISRFNPTVEPWSGVVRLLGAFDRPARVRATVLATELSPLDRLDLSHRIATVARALLEVGLPRDTAFNLERAQATMLNLQASFASPLLISELAVCSPEPLPDSFLRAIAASFTSEVDVLRRQGRIVVAGQRLLLGGFEIERDPVDLDRAHAAGLPLRGGLAGRDLRDLITLTESPIGWPVPLAAPLPGIPARRGNALVPERLRRVEGDGSSPLGVVDDGVEVGLPPELRPRHLVLTGTWGAGKSTVAGHMAVDDLRAGRPFVLIDPHGSLAEHVVAWADHLGQEVVVVDPQRADTFRISPFDRITEHGDRDDVERQIGHLCDAVASALPNAEWAGVRWTAFMRSLLEVQAVHAASFDEIVTWCNDRSALRPRLRHPLVSDLARSTLATLVGELASREAGDVATWVSSKLHTLVSGPPRKIFARPGDALTIADLVELQRPVVVNTGSMSPNEGALVGHLVIEAAVEAAMARPRHDRRLFSLFVDEAPGFPAAGLRTAMTEGRKFELGLVLISQSLGQLDAALGDLALGAGTNVVFRATPDTATRTAAHLGLTRDELLQLPDLNAFVAVHGQSPVRVTVPPLALPA